MGAFKLDLMTILVLFVVFSVGVTMYLGTKDSKQTTENQSVIKAPAHSLSETSTVSNAAPRIFRASSAALPAKQIRRTWY